MRRPSIESAQKLFLVLALILIAVSFLRVRGQDDVLIWKRWVQNALDFGLVRGLAENNSDYPPLAALMLFGGWRFFSLFGLLPFLAIKWLILVFLLLTTLVFWLWTRDFWMTVILYLSLLLGSVLLGYIDVFIGPTVLLALWALKVRKLWLFSLSFAVACLTKWLPLVLLPFMALYILDVQGARGWRRINFKGILLEVVLPAAAVIALVLLVYGTRLLRLALLYAFNQDWLSGDALNFSWIVTHWLHVYDPAQFGPLVDGRADNIIHAPPEVTRWPNLLFWLFYGSTLAAFFWRPKTFENMVRYALIGVLVYFAFNVGVHENHLYLPVLVACVLAWLNRRHLLSATFWILMFNMNLILFYGFQGTLDFNRVLGGVDMALVFSILILVYTLGEWLAGILRPRMEPKVTNPGEGDFLRQTGRSLLR